MKHRRQVRTLDMHCAELELLYRAAPVGLALLDTELRYVRINDQLAAIAGRRPEDIIGQSLHEIVPDMAPKLETITRRVIDADQPSLGHELKGIVPSDPHAVKSFLADYYPLRAAGEVQGVLAVVREITALKTAQAKIAWREGLFQAFMDHSPALIYMKDSDRRHSYANKPMLETYGVSLEDFVGTRSGEFLPAKVAAEIEEVDEAIRSRRSQEEVLEHRVEGGGKVRWWHDIKFPVESPSGEWMVGGIAVEVTEQKRAEAQLEVMKFSVEHALDRVEWIAPDGRFLYANKAACEAMGYTLEELLLMTISDVSPEMSPDVWASRFQKVKRAGSTRFERSEVRADGKTRYVEVSARLIQSAEMDFSCNFGRDITEQKLSKERLAEELRFTALVAEIASRFIDLPLEDVDGAINDGLERVGTNLGLARCSLGHLTADGKRALMGRY